MDTSGQNSRRPFVALDDVALRYRGENDADSGIQALEGLTLRVHQGEFIAVVGPSGCGKSTLVSLIARLADPSAGRIVFALDVQPPNPVDWRR